MMDDDKLTDAALERLFEEARKRPPALPEGLMARVMADAVALQPAQASFGWRGWLRLLGGAPGLGGLVTASAVGLWLGVSPPEALPDVAGLILDAEASEPLEGLDLWSDGGWSAEES